MVWDVTEAVQEIMEVVRDKMEVVTHCRIKQPTCTQDAYLAS